MGDCHLTEGRMEAAIGIWSWPMRRQSRPAGRTRVAAVGRIVAKRSTARRVTMSARGCENVLGKSSSERGGSGSCGLAEPALGAPGSGLAKLGSVGLAVAEAARYSSARPANTLTSVNVRERATSRRKVAFLWFDSMRVRRIEGSQILVGRPGKPAPEPTSIRRGWDPEAAGGTTPPCRRERDKDGAPGGWSR
jgi:hypothetical protein